MDVGSVQGSNTELVKAKLDLRERALREFHPSGFNGCMSPITGNGHNERV
jgi:hypothetical protein